MPQWAWKLLWCTHVPVIFCVCWNLIPLPLKVLAFENKEIDRNQSFSGSLSKGNYTSPKGTKIWRDQFDPENWMITKESNYSHYVYTRFWPDSCSYFFNYACINRAITHPMQYHLQLGRHVSKTKYFSLMKQYFTKGHWKNAKSSPPSSWTSQSCRVRWEWPKLKAR